MKRKVILCAIAFASYAGIHLKSQNDVKYNPVLTGVPSLQISPDARAAGMGDAGVSTLADEYSQFWNPAKYPYVNSTAGISFSYTPWLAKLVNDIALMETTAFYKFGRDANQAVSASLRYFTLGKIEQWDEGGKSLGYSSPNEFAFDVAYSRQLSENFSMGVALRYIHADRRTVNDSKATGNAFAADISGYLHKYVMMGQAEGLWTLGFNIKNIGTKMNFQEDDFSTFIPTNLGIGTGLVYPIDEYNQIAFNVEVNKLLVPTPPYVNDGTPEEREKKRQEYNNTGSIKGIFSSFTDAPGGFKEELKEIKLNLGAEYSYNDKFFVRTGYSYLSPEKGNLQFFTAGAGFKMNVFRIDASYLISTVQSNPLDQTLRFSIAFNMDGIKNLFH